MITPETLDKLIGKIKIKKEDSSAESYFDYPLVEFLNPDGQWPTELNSQFQCLVIYCLDYLAYKIAEKKFAPLFIKKAKVHPPSIDLELPEHFEDLVERMILSNGISSSLINKKDNEIKSYLFSFLAKKEFRRYEQTLGLHGSVDFMFRPEYLYYPDLRNLLNEYD